MVLFVLLVVGGFFGFLIYGFQQAKSQGLVPDASNKPLTKKQIQKQKMKDQKEQQRRGRSAEG